MKTTMKPNDMKPQRSGNSNGRRAGGIVRRASNWRPGFVVALLACMVFFGCQTGRSWTDGCPGIYSGVRYYNSHIGSMPWDGKIFFGLDLPFSAILDTLLLPFSAFVDRDRPAGGWVPGCEWVKK